MSLVVRPARLTDLPTMLEFARLSGAGFTSLPEDEPLLASKLAKSEAAFAASATDEERRAGYLLMLEKAGLTSPVGCAAVKPGVGLEEPFFNFRIMKIAQASFAAQRRFDLDVLMLVNDYAGCTEVGTLFLHPDHRGGGAGSLLSLSRFLLIASDPERFDERILAELRGYCDDDGRSPFWERLGRTFFKMDFADADHFCATSDKQFIIDLMPKYPIYAELLPEDARAVIGKCHPDGLPAMAMLEREGFRFEGVVDIFDAGPLVSVPRKDLATLQNSVQLPIAVYDIGDAQRLLISNDKINGFRATLAPVRITRDAMLVSQATLDSLNMKAGDVGRVRLK
mgnify:CR=1 FL=1